MEVSFLGQPNLLGSYLFVIVFLPRQGLVSLGLGCYKKNKNTDLFFLRCEGLQYTESRTCRQPGLAAESLARVTGLPRASKV